MNISRLDKALLAFIIAAMIGLAAAAIVNGCGGPDARNDQSAGFEKINKRQDKLQATLEGVGHTLIKVDKTTENTHNLQVQISEQTQGSGEVDAEIIKNMRQRVDNSQNKWWNMVILAASLGAFCVLQLALIYFLIREFMAYKFGVRRAIASDDNNLNSDTWRHHLTKK